MTYQYRISVDPQNFHHDFLFPENLELFPDWLKPVLGESRHLNGCITGFILTRTPTWELAEELLKLQSLTDLTLRNSDLGAEGREGWPMCRTLSSGFEVTRQWVVTVLSSAAFTVTKNYILSLGCLEESPSGTRFLHDLTSDLKNRGTYAKYEGMPAPNCSAFLVAQDLKKKGEAIVASLPPEEVYSLLAKAPRRKNYLTGA